MEAYQCTRARCPNAHRYVLVRPEADSVSASKASKVGGRRFRILNVVEDLQPRGLSMRSAISRSPKVEEESQRFPVPCSLARTPVPDPWRAFGYNPARSGRHGERDTKLRRSRRVRFCRHPSRPRVEWPDLPGRGNRQRLSVRRQNLSVPHRHHKANHRHPVLWVLPPSSVGEMTLRLYGALSYSQDSARDPRCALNGA